MPESMTFDRMEIGKRTHDLISFLSDMDEKLRDNIHKGHWAETDIVKLFYMTHDELDELEHEIDRMTKGDASNEVLWNIVYECADVANYAMMIASNAKRMMK